MRKLCLTGQAVLIIALLSAQCASAGSMRCGVHLINDGGRHGPGKYEVLKKCGEPTYRQGNIWIYDKDSGRSKKVFHFNDSGLLTLIE